MKQDMVNLKYRLDILNDVSIPQKIRDAVKLLNSTLPPSPRPNLTSSPTIVHSTKAPESEPDQEIINCSKTSIDDAMDDISSDELN